MGEEEEEEEEEEEVGVVKADRRSLDSDEGVLDPWPRREGDRSGLGVVGGAGDK
jgi:hypothetical protein